jgi:hypothetical protein
MSFSISDDASRNDGTETFAPEFANLVVVAGRFDELMRCPDCGTLYIYETRYEYDAYGPSEDYYTLTRLDDAVTPVIDRLLQPLEPEAFAAGLADALRGSKETRSAAEHLKFSADRKSASSASTQAARQPRGPVSEQRQVTKEEWFDLFFRYSGAEAAGMDRAEYHRNFFGAEEKPGMTYWANELPNSDDVTFRMEPGERELHMFLEASGDAASTEFVASGSKLPHVSYGVPEPEDDEEPNAIRSEAKTELEDYQRALKADGADLTTTTDWARLLPSYPVTAFDGSLKALNKVLDGEPFRSQFVGPDYGSLLLEVVADECHDVGAKRRLYLAAKTRAEIAASGATSGGEGMALSIPVDRIERKLRKLDL